MASKKISGTKPPAPTGGINWYGPAFTKTINRDEIKAIINDFRRGVVIASESGFDAVEVHAGHGYLISQFLSPYSNKRKDKYGGSFENRSRFLREVIAAVKETLPKNMALIVKMNCSDGIKKGITKEEGILTAKTIENCGSDAIVVSGGFVSKSPMYVLRGKMPVDIMAYFMNNGIRKIFVKTFGKSLIKTIEFNEGYFMNEAADIRNRVNIPVILVGGMNSKTIITKALEQGFEFISFARALIENTNFINDLKNGDVSISGCTICNYCVARMYSKQIKCHLNEKDIEPKLRKMIEKIDKAEE
jgi:2,4-dienoyl-CoA reductase-like NADH-dependent reductase (Old Yellow Enzyme family)